MNLDEFCDLVLAMRGAQKKYFRYRDKDALRESKKLESQVDEFLRNQGTLFTTPIYSKRPKQ